MNVNSVTSLLPSYLLPFNSTANTANANSASSVQQQADVLTLPSADQFLTQLQQVQSPQQFQAMISQITGQPLQTNTTASNGGNTNAASGGTPPTAKHCQGGGSHHASRSSQASTTNLQNQSLLANIFGSINPPQSAAL
jgi:hypothetical protein